MAQSNVAPVNTLSENYSGKPLREKRRKSGFVKKAKRLRLRGMISDKAAKRHLGQD